MNNGLNERLDREMRKQERIRQVLEQSALLEAERRNHEAIEKLKCRLCKVQDDCSLGKKLICIDDSRNKLLEETELSRISLEEFTDEELKNELKDK